MRGSLPIHAIVVLLIGASLTAPACADQLHGFSLPDEGPRYETPLSGPDGVRFTEGLTALKGERYQDADQAFNSVVRDYPTSTLKSASLAFIADLIAKKGTDHHRRQAIEAYRALIRDFPASTNALRARWRIGDLYAQDRWLVEAKASYEQSLAESPSEAPRALFGLGLVCLEGGEWTDAEHAFQQVKKRTDDERLVVPATFALAEALGRSKRWEKAQSAYESGIRRWPAAFKRRPESILQFADVKLNLQKYGEARALLEQFYNLYPTHPEAPSALIRVGDSWRQSARLDRAKTLYAAVVQKHSGTYQESIARMRLAELAREVYQQGNKTGPELGIGALLDGRPAGDDDSRAQEEMLEQIVRAYAGSELGSEGLFHLGEHLEARDRRLESVDVYRRLSDRKGLLEGDPWPEAGGRRLIAMLGPWMVAALQSHDDLTAVNLFYRHGAYGEDLYAGNGILLLLAEAHHRLGFTPQAIKLYRTLVQDTVPDAIREKAFVGLGLAYLDQRDLPAARRVFERTLLQYPAGQARTMTLTHLADTLHRQGDWNGVIRVGRLWLRHARPESPNGHRMLHLMADAQVKIGHLEQALDTLARIMSAARADVEGASLPYADRLLDAGQYEQAAMHYRQIIQTPPSPTDADWARLQLAKIRRTQKRYGDARTLLQEVQSMTTDELVNRISAALLADLPQTTRQAGG